MSDSIFDKDLHDRAYEVIPGGLYGHRGFARSNIDIPHFFTKASGSRVWDSSGRRYIDFHGAYGPNLFGYSNWEIDDDAIAQMRKCDMMTGHPPLLVDVAEKLVGIIKHADWAILCTSGSDASSMAAECARAYTGKSKILVGVAIDVHAVMLCAPPTIALSSENMANTVYFDSGNLQSLQDALNANAGEVAAVCIPPFCPDAQDYHSSSSQYARAIRRLCDEHDALLVLDEVQSGFRLHRGGSWDIHAVFPDLSIWGQGLGNGHPIGAVLGNDKIRQAASQVSKKCCLTYSAVSMAAALKTLHLIESTAYLERTIILGHKICNGLAAGAEFHNFELQQVGPVQMPQLRFNHDADFEKGRQWSSSMVAQGVYLNFHHKLLFNAAMSLHDTDVALQASEEAFRTLRGHLAKRRRASFHIV